MTSQPYYLPLADEVDVFRAAYAARLPVLLKGPTGCGKTRFVEHMTWLLAQDKTSAADQPLITVTRTSQLLTWLAAICSKAMRPYGQTVL